jgi:hypothetical protein
MPGTVNKLREAVDTQPGAAEVVPQFLHFWRDVNHIRSAEDNGFGTQHQRFIKFENGMHYRTHPVLTMGDGSCSYFNPARWPFRFTASWFKIFHYSYMNFRKDKVVGKKAFYEKELGQPKHGGVAAQERGGNSDDFVNFSEKQGAVLLYTDSHPDIVASQPWFGDKEPTYDGVAFRDYKETKPYSYAPEALPLMFAWYLEGRCGPFVNDIGC